LGCLSIPKNRAMIPVRKRIIIASMSIKKLVR
jgi:hypothetical protein